MTLPNKSTSFPAGVPSIKGGEYTAPSLARRTTQMPLKPIVQQSNNAAAEEGQIMKNQYISQTNRIIGSDFLVRNVLLQRIRGVLQSDEDEAALYVGEGVSEVISSAANEMLWNAISDIGKTAETKISPGDGVKVTWVESKTDKLRAELEYKDEKKPREIRRDGKRVIRVTMSDVMATRKKLLKRGIRRAEIKSYENK
ncbi:hypothetical protein EIN_224390 [Entamoeba invadens IP1]|uniref:Uncharacterized protein n=1 Tax=Entamoeba invadens IP1 TaxID=370355 RepID=A0A0A1U297_ENTIV|nr:hypothetical protein EIN_224390 [Entamoeba invadens IP1]ELP88196.1 hypothetical protein EIN_224390 [Entamoeba invadens IP1]|eukprot:XP_004254967.1 hypothetical protein EIN_224390 [Entamoeba invadens IP1]